MSQRDSKNIVHVKNHTCVFDFIHPTTKMAWLKNFTSFFVGYVRSMLTTQISGCVLRNIINCIIYIELDVPKSYTQDPFMSYGAVSNLKFDLRR